MTDTKVHVSKKMAESSEYWDQARETALPKVRAEQILERVKAQVHYVYEELPFYRRLYDKHKVRPDQIRTLKDFARRIPVVTKDMLREDQAQHPPFGSYSNTRRGEIARIFGSSGTTGTPTIYAISRQDWERAAEAQAMAVWAMGVRPTDIVHLLFPFSLFVGGWAVLHGADRIGAGCFTAGALDTRRHLELLERLQCTVLAGTPSYILHMIGVAQEMGIDLHKSPVHTLIVGGEPGGSLAGPRAAMKAGFGDQVRVADSGNTSECFPTQMNSSCREETGVHIFEDEVFLELVARDDPTAVVPDGQTGATVYTTLWRKSQPMIRFSAGDETYMVRDLCRCGRTYPRLPDGLTGRIDDMLLIRGANIYPSAVENVLRQVPGIGREYRIVVDKKGPLDEATIEAEYSADWVQDQVDAVSARQVLADSIADQLKRVTGLRFGVRVVDPGTHEQMLFKARRVIDRRPPLK